MDKALDILNDLSEKLIYVPTQDFIQIIPEKACKLLSVPIGILWQFNEEKRKFRVVACSSQVDEEYQKSELDLDYPSVTYLFEKNKVLALADINKSSVQLSHLDKLNERQWVSLLTAPLKIEDRIIGILSVFDKKPYVFEDWQKKFLTRLANYTALSVQKEGISTDRDKLQNLSNIMIEMTEATEQYKLWELLQKGALELVNSKQVWISKLNHHTGTLDIVTSSQPAFQDPEIRFGKGITGKALEEEKPQRADDVLNDLWKEFYIQRWENTRSELAIPILIDKILVREKTEVKLGTKVIGVLNIESPHIKAFSETDEKRIELLTRFAAMRFERLELDRKLKELRQVETELIKHKTYEEIIKIIVDSMTKILGFEWVNISLIDKGKNQIKSESVEMTDWSDETVEKFKKMATHSLYSNDIQADIVRKRDIEVPDQNDPRFDPLIFENFDLKNLVRVYIPMIAPFNNQVIGTVEVGHTRKYRKYISEQDVQVLKSFVDYVVHALERKKSGFIDKIAHELKSPIVGIKNNASYLQRRITELETEKMKIKFDDILGDCELLLYQVKQIEYFMGRSAFQQPRIEKTYVFRDIIVKTINQLKTTIVRDYGFPTEKIEYDQDSIRRIIVKTDKAKLNQVVYNLLINSIKYAEEEPNKFRIRIEVTDDKKSFTIKFKDWGIGIKEEDKDNIFQEGFRSQEAIVRHVTGSGFGLAISKEIMKQLGGDLKLYRLSKPTEFHLILPQTN